MKQFTTLYSLIQKEDEAFKKVKGAENMYQVYCAEAVKASEDDKPYFLSLAAKQQALIKEGEKELVAARQELFAYFEELKTSCELANKYKSKG